MNFDLAPEQTALYNALDRFFQKELSAERLLGVVGSEQGVDEGLWRGLADLGVTGLLVPEEYGGVGLGMLDAAVVSESLGWHAAPGPFLGHVLATLAIATGGSAEQKENGYPAWPVASCWALSLWENPRIAGILNNGRCRGAVL